MKETKWTQNQLKAIQESGTNMLVAAAAGSGKTAVLVERIINKILNENIDIDKLLVVTFTNAAASEMRQRVLTAIYQKLEEDPNNERLHRQLMLLNKSNISTIHSFCLDIIRNYFFETNMSANFRIGDNTEINLLKWEAIEEIFDDLYEKEDEDFQLLIDTYTTYKTDDLLKEMVLEIYQNIRK